MKLSEGKETLPGAKQVFRGDGLSDHLGLAAEEPPAGTEPLLVPVMQDGRRLGGGRSEPGEALAAARARLELDLAALPEAARDLDRPVAPVAQITPALQALTAETRARRR
jgi:nicotinate phosphoribosyltransferase